MDFENHIEYARGLDLTDPLKSFRDKFYIPLVKDGSPSKGKKSVQVKLPSILGSAISI